jgi:hypothetical protein
MPNHVRLSKGWADANYKRSYARHVPDIRTANGPSRDNQLSDRCICKPPSSTSLLLLLLFLVGFAWAGQSYGPLGPWSRFSHASCERAFMNLEHQGLQDPDHWIRAAAATNV